jgi:exodeoxyribonuclease-3
MRITTWNVNSVRQRLEHLLAVLREEAPDVLCLQELKCQDDAFPRAEVEAAGYRVETHGQKGFNGVAILSKAPLEDVTRGLPGDPSDEQSRYIEGVVEGVRVASIYLPNGNPVPGPKYDYKLAWFDRLILHARERLGRDEALVLCGDYNVIPDERDASDPAAWAGDALFLPQSRAKLRELIHLGFIDAVRACDDSGGLYTFWDYQAGAFQRNHGIRIDHLLLSGRAADRLQGVAIHKHVRGWEKPSDHVPVSAILT